MDLLDVFRTLARYNKVANARLYEQCGKLELAEYRRERPGSFGSIHALLNHTLLGDRIWMSRFAGGGSTTPPLNTVLFETFAELSSARSEQDAGIESFFANVDDGFVTRSLRYTNSLGKDCTDPAPHAVLHFFNHQTHHRGQAHAALTMRGVDPGDTDLFLVVPGL